MNSKKRPFRPWFLIALVVAAGVVAAAALLQGEPSAETLPPEPRRGERRVAVLLVSHGSRSERWRDMLTAVDEAVRDRVLAGGRIGTIRSAFMEYTEPSIATRLEEFDNEGYTDVILVPLLLTVSSHSFDDIPTICGQKEDAVSLATLRAEGTRIYKPRARIHTTPLLDFPAMLEENVVRRVHEMSVDPGDEGVVLVAYGDAEYNEEWEEMMERLGTVLTERTGIELSTYAWCGHLVHYDRAPTKNAILRVLEEKKRVLVVPLLVAVDENFQNKLIGGAVQETGAAERISYLGDAILPDPGLEEWVVDIVRNIRDGMEAEEAAP